MAILKLIDISKSYANKKILDNINFKCENELISLLGPSGCGKTTCLRTIAGFEKPDNGNIYLNGNDIVNIPPNKRNIGMVFQNYALFPHLNVYENVAYGLKVKKLKKNEIKEKVNDALNMVNLEGFENYNINELSGGMQQRVAVARALVIEPEGLLLDEPLSNLDAKLRIKMRKELKKLQRDLNIPSIYVTHDQEEALVISDRIGVMNNGKIEQLDSPKNIYNYPKTAFIANFIGNINEVPKDMLNYLNTDYDINYKYFIRPENIVVGKRPFIGKIVDMEYLGNLVRYTIKYNDNILISEIHNPKKILKEGDEVLFNIKKEAILKINHKI